MSEHDLYRPPGRGAVAVPPAAVATGSPAPPAAYPPPALPSYGYAGRPPGAGTATLSTPYVLASGPPAKATLARAVLVAMVVLMLAGAVATALTTGLFSEPKKTQPTTQRKATPVVPPRVVYSDRPAAPYIEAPVTPQTGQPPTESEEDEQLRGKPLSVTSANSGTLGGAYSIVVPEGWHARLKQPGDKTRNTDVVISHARTGQTVRVWSIRPEFAFGMLMGDETERLKEHDLAGEPTMKVLASSSMPAAANSGNGIGYDATFVADQRSMSRRTVYFMHSDPVKGPDNVYGASWTAATEDFPVSVQTFHDILNTMDFAR